LNLLFDVGTNHAVKIWGVIEGAPLRKYGQLCQIVVSFYQVVKPGKIVPAMIFQRD
jgi:hypothetical protein